MAHYNDTEGHRQSLILAAALAAIVAITLFALVTFLMPERSQTAGRVATSSPPPSRSAPVSAAPAAARLQADEVGSDGAEVTSAKVSPPTPPLQSFPRRVRIPAVGIDAPLVTLGLDDDGRLEVPADFDQAGWYEEGPKPGETGPAVIAAHVDSKRGPAAFFRLGELRSGHSVFVDYDGGRTERFEVYHRGQFPKDSFPTAAVYGDTERSELRLITCGGSFDRSTGHYRDNIVVWAAAVMRD